jgi:hypothetical protein
MTCRLRRRLSLSRFSRCLTEALDQPVRILEGLWDGLKGTLWADPKVVASDDEIKTFNTN